MPSASASARGRDRSSVARRRGAAPVVRVREGAVQVSEVQRARVLNSAAAVVFEVGYPKMSVSRVTRRARVSRRTFYDLFADREDCFLAVSDDALARVSECVLGAYEGERGVWRERVRAALSALLACFDEEPRIGSLLVVSALGAGPRILERRAEVLGRVSAALQRDGSSAAGARKVPPLTGEGVLGAVLGLIHTRLSSRREAGRMVELLNPSMAMIVLPFLGSAAAARELERPLPRVARSSAARARAQKGSSSSSSSPVSDPLADLSMRVTYRTLRVLSAVGGGPGASNRVVGERAGIYDQGQISKLMARLERLGLIENTTANDHQPTGEPNAWRLTPRGEDVERAMRVPVGKDRPHVDAERGEGERR